MTDPGKENIIYYVWRQRENRIYLGIICTLSSGLWILFKHFFPYPNIVFDSYYYIQAAKSGAWINVWPIGYSKFLAVIHLVSSSPGVPISTQYCILQISSIWFFFTFLFLFRPVKLIKWVLILLFFANPLIFVCSNYFLSDTIFISLSLLWITQLFWLILRPRPYMIFTHALLLLFAFTVRYNALYYPLIGMFGIFLSSLRPTLKWIGALLPIILVAAFILFTSDLVAGITGHRQFSPFGGWKLANNALYVYGNIINEKKDLVPSRFRPLDSTARSYFLKSSQWRRPLEDDPSTGSYFMFHPNSPLARQMPIEYWYGFPRFGSYGWYSVANLYQDYASYWIRSHPIAYAQYFILPNFSFYLEPPLEIFGSYAGFNLVNIYGAKMVEEWYGLRALSTKPSLIKLIPRITSIYPTIFEIFHCIFLIGLLYFLSSGRLKSLGQKQLYCFLLLVSLWGIDLLFSTFSAIVVLRYQIFVMTLEMSFGLYFARLFALDLRWLLANKILALFGKSYSTNRWNANGKN